MSVEVVPDLLARARIQLERAARSGALQPTGTEAFTIEDGGVLFHVRVIIGPDRKKRPRGKQFVSGEDPFRPPYVDDLFVADLSDTHVLLLNKFPVLEDHLLIVTREDLPQQGWLDVGDFQALAACMAHVDGLGFYNGGRAAGASQPHRHLQLVPMPFTTGALLASEDAGFRCASAEVGRAADAGALHGAYRALMAELRIDADRDPYNVLVFDGAIHVVPRTAHAARGLPLNAMGYAGSFLVRTREQLEELRRIGPRRLLQEAGRPG